ncbi:TRAP transporter small permease subunit [Martelella mediterranea]|uniref:TRAP transporter small permease n=1 Tax=Martelella mediterranea TaxID=293089 RepID=UPI001E4A5E13|nr:TRAP transporter small permease subunit [Martelella mediterranea]MCD1634343.1 TRAP transporter small permease subunit [Martelella mediterranea]
MARLSNMLAVVGLSALLAVTALTLFDIALRSDIVYGLRDLSPGFDNFVMNSGIDGLSDLYAPLGIVAIAFCFPAMAAGRSAITVRFLIDVLPWRLRETLDVCGHLCLLAMFALMAWWVSDYTLDIWRSGETTWLLNLPRWPAWALASLALWMSTLIQFVVLARQCGRAISASEPPPLENAAEGAE